MKNLTVSILLIFLLVFNLSAKNDSWMIYDDSQVAIIEITMNPADVEWLFQPANWSSDQEKVASVRFRNAQIDEVIDSVGFRLRGNTSRNAAKKSFKLSFNTFMPGRQFYDVEKMNLNGEHNDPSISRSKLCWDLFQDIGMQTSRAAHAAVYINDKYYGLYVSVEHIDEEFLSNHFEDDSGNLWKCLWPADLSYRGDDPENYKPYYDNTRPYELKTNRAENDFSQLARLIRIINETPDSRFADSLETILAVPEALKYLAMNILTGSWDDYWSLMNNYYLYYEPQADLFHWIPYDYDNTLGIDFWDKGFEKSDPYTFIKINDGPRPLAERLLNNPEYRNLYTHFLHYYRDKVFLLGKWESRLQNMIDLITPYAEQDNFRELDYQFTLEDFRDSFDASDYSNKHVRRGIREFVILRSNYMLGQLNWVDAGPIVYDINCWPRTPGPDDSIHVEVAAFSNTGLNSVTINYQPGNLQINEEYPMSFTPVVGTKKVEEADRWTVSLPPLGSNGFAYFEVVAVDKNGSSQSFPRDEALFVGSSALETEGLVINEFLAQNDSVNQDVAGEFDDWLELYNSGSNDIDLSGFYLSDNPDNLKKWQIPDGTSLGSGGHLLIWCDEDQEQTGLHTNFKLAANGEFIALLGKDSSFIDSLTYGAQTRDVSYGRFPDGSGNWQFLTPTPEQSNAVTSIRENRVPHNFALDIFPNPFNNSATMRYTMATSGPVSIEIYDVLGRLIWTKSYNLQTAGEHRLNWQAVDNNGAQVSTGVYLCQIRSGSVNALKKMVLMK